MIIFPKMVSLSSVRMMWRNRVSYFSGNLMHINCYFMRSGSLSLCRAAISPLSKNLVQMKECSRYDQSRYYCDQSASLPVMNVHVLNRLHRSKKKYDSNEPHPGMILAKVDFNEPYPTISEKHFLSLACMDLLLKFAYPAIDGYSKFTLILTILTPSGNVSFAVGPAIPLTSPDGKVYPKEEVYAHIFHYIALKADIYNGVDITSLSVRIYLSSKKEKKDRSILSDEYISSTLSSFLKSGKMEIAPRPSLRICNLKRFKKPPRYISALKESSTELKPFLVADLETLMIAGVHKCYAAGLLLVRPGEDLSSQMDCIETYFSEDYKIILEDFEDRSSKVLSDLIRGISRMVRRDQSIQTIYFHNFARFDGIILLKHLACHQNGYTLKPLMRNNVLYELVVYEDQKMLFRFRDSIHQLPGTLAKLAKNLCPDLGSKGSFPHEDVRLDTLESMKPRLLDYMRQDILLLGGIMQKAQSLYWDSYRVDIESKITLSSLALTIFRMCYYDPINWPIHIPSQNEDSFIRRGYYGGHVDVYKPKGENLNYYDVNSLYPYVMKSFPMPGGQPKWHGNFEGKDLDQLFGFIEAYIVCPKTLKKPFLPFRDEKGTLIFPSGSFIGVYYSEELKYAKGLGYTVIPLSGYLFERMESPFEEFVSSLFESRAKARESGNDALSYVYKILMNTLYGRFGINPKSTVTEVCSPDRYKNLLRNSELIFAEMLSENHYIVSYWSNTGKCPSLDYWNPPRISAVQLSAAITASARIYMYPYISREDCYYTDTDSVVLGHELPAEMISSSELGQFKLENRILQGYFLAPKSYSFMTESDEVVLKHKGPAKEFVTHEWFESQFEDLSRKELVQVKSNFRINWHKLDITKKDTQFILGIQVGTKRNPVYHGNVWVDTEPIEITSLGGLNTLSQILIKGLQKTLLQHQEILLQHQDEKTNLLSRLADIERKLAEKGIDGYKDHAIIHEKDPDIISSDRELYAYQKDQEAEDKDTLKQKGQKEVKPNPPSKGTGKNKTHRKHKKPP